MPKAVPTLYNHHQRPSTSRILNVETTTSGQCTISSRVHSVVVPIASTATLLEAKYFPMDMDMDSDTDEVLAQPLVPVPNDIDDDDDDEGVQAQESRFKGIKVKAKRHMSSVHSTSY